MDDFDELIAAAHENDVKVIIDLVLNHTSNQHPWFDQAVQALLENEQNNYIEYYNFTRDSPGAGYAQITDEYYYECRFVSTMPDLNLDSPAVRAEIAKIAAFWLDRGVDGFRLDAVTSFYTGNQEKNVAFLQWLNSTVKEIDPDAYLIGEAWTDSGAVAAYYQSGIDSFFNFPYSQAGGRLANAIHKGEDSEFAVDLSDWNMKIRTANPNGKDALFLSNHDQGRSAGFLTRSLDKEKMAAALYLLAPGNPFIYYGEEIGMTGSGADPNKRLPMIWSDMDTAGQTYPPPGATQNTEGLPGVEKQLRDPASLLNHYRKILLLKARNPEIARGEMNPVATENPGIIAFNAEHNGKKVYVFHNLSGESQILEPGLTEQGISIEGFLVAGKGKPRLSRGQLSLPPLSTTILR